MVVVLFSIISISSLSFNGSGGGSGCVFFLSVDAAAAAPVVCDVRECLCSHKRLVSLCAANASIRLFHGRADSRAVSQAAVG